MTHVLCELLMRLRAVEPVEDHAFELALTQGDLADALGISNVHVTRVLQDSQNQGLISPCTRETRRCWTGRGSDRRRVRSVLTAPGEESGARNGRRGLQPKPDRSIKDFCETRARTCEGPG
jgi:DNA-binding MarR family transcriptional regulator